MHRLQERYRLLLLAAVLSAALGCARASQCSAAGINVYQTNITSPINSILFGANKFVYALTHDGTLWLSKNGGQDWVDQTPFMPNVLNSNYSISGQSHGIRMMYLSAAKHVAYFLGQDFIYWVYEADSDRYHTVTTGDHAQKGDSILYLEPHPEQETVLLRVIEDSSCFNITQQNCFYRYDVSQTNGFTEPSWVTMASYVGYQVQFGPDKLVYYTQINETMQHGYQNFRTNAYSFYVADFYGSEVVRNSPEGFTSFLYDDGALFLTKYDSDSRFYDAFVSTDNGHTFVQMNLVSDTGGHVDGSFYLIINTAQNVSFVNVQHYYGTFGDLYVADNDPTTEGQYWQTLKYNRFFYANVDFTEIRSMNGVFLANSYNLTDWYASPQFSKDLYVKTAISFDKAAEWNLIPAPSGCEECSLNLYQGYDKGVIATVLSPSASVGLAMAHGSEGEYLLSPESTSGIGLYFTRNGGYSWSKLMDGKYHYQIASHGSLVFLTSADSTTSVQYSWDQGLSFIECEISDTNFTTASIYIVDSEDTEHSLKFLVVATDAGHNTGFMYLVDFESAAPSLCQGEDEPGSSNSDYEYFTPSTGDYCLLGESVRYIRRKQSASCWSWYDETSESLGSCPCTQNDYACDGSCFATRIQDGERVCWNVCAGQPDDPQQPPEPCYDTYNMTQGYILVEGDMCEGGLDLNPVVVSCQAPASVLPSPSPSETPKSVPTPTASVSAKSSYSVAATVSPSPASNQTNPPVTSNTDGASVGLIIVAIILCVLIVFGLSILVLLVLYKSSPQVRNIMNRYLPKKWTGAEDDDQLYQVVGSGGDSLFDEDLENEPEAVPVNSISMDGQNNGSGFGSANLLDLNDDDFDF